MAPNDWNPKKSAFYGAGTMELEWNLPVRQGWLSVVGICNLKHRNFHTKTAECQGWTQLQSAAVGGFRIAWLGAFPWATWSKSAHSDADSVMMKPRCYSEYSIQGPSILVASSWVWSLREVVHPNLHLIRNLKNTQIFQGAQWIRRKGMSDLKTNTPFSVLITGPRFYGFLFLLNLIMLIILRRSYLDWYKLIEPRFNQRYKYLVV